MLRKIKCILPWMNYGRGRFDPLSLNKQGDQLNHQALQELKIFMHLRDKTSQSFGQMSRVLLCRF